MGLQRVRHDSVAKPLPKQRYCVIPLVQGPQSRQIQGDREWLVVSRSQEEAEVSASWRQSLNLGR